MPRYLTRSLQVVLDMLVLSIAFWGAFGLRFEFALSSYWAQVAVIDWPYVVALEYLVLTLFGIPKYAWRYISMRDSVSMGTALCVSTALLVFLRFGLANVHGMLQLAVLPLSVIAINLVLALVGLIGIRIARRAQGEAHERKRRSALTRDGGRLSPPRTRVLLIGAGEAGVIVARELASRPDLGLQPVGYLDDDRHKTGMQISGLTVLGTTAMLTEVAERKHVTRVLLTIANASAAELRRITLLCRQAGLQVQIIPGLYEIVGGTVNLSRIREVAIEDLLGRRPVQLDESVVSSAIRDRVVMVTGAGGSIGSELCRQLAQYQPRQLVLVEQFENALFELHRELGGTHPALTTVPCVADVTDHRRMDQVFAATRPTFVFHAAAHKHVPMMEANPGEAVKNNVAGTRLVADLASTYQVERFVLVSTDKAVNPTSVMGATKRVAEIYTQALGQVSKTRFVTVRFGNVLGSNGSVIPIFKQQIAAGGPVTVTHPDMQRYFMTIPEASQLVLQAGAMGSGGEMFVLDMGKPVKIVDLARDLISLSGFKPGADIMIEFTSMRPGEKLFEELSTSEEHVDRTTHPKIFVGRVRPRPHADAVRVVEELLMLAHGADPGAIRGGLKAVVPEYTGAPAARSTEPAVSAARSTEPAVSAAASTEPAVSAARSTEPAVSAAAASAAPVRTRATGPAPVLPSSEATR